LNGIKDSIHELIRDVISFENLKREWVSFEEMSKKILIYMMVWDFIEFHGN